MICDADLLAKEVAAHHLDMKRMPLGKLSKAQLSQGYRLLNQLSTTLKEMAELKQMTEPKPQVKEKHAPAVKQEKSQHGQTSMRRSSLRLVKVEKKEVQEQQQTTTMRRSVRSTRPKRCQKILSYH